MTEHAVEIERGTNNLYWINLYGQWTSQTRNYTEPLFLEWLVTKLPITRAEYRGYLIVLYFENRETWLEFALKLLT
jgi:hypothetical protein